MVTIMTIISSYLRGKVSLEDDDALPCEIPAGGYETRAWIPAREIEWLWDNTRPGPKRPTALDYIRARVAGAVPPPDPGPPEEPYRCDPPAGVPDPMDYRWDPEREEWVLRPGWWQAVKEGGPTWRQ
jgi:hypothetical protein